MKRIHFDDGVDDDGVVPLEIYVHGVARAKLHGHAFRLYISLRHSMTPDSSFISFTHMDVFYLYVYLSTYIVKREQGGCM